MGFTRTLLLCTVLLGCERHRPRTPDWVLSAPPAAVMAISCRADWALEEPHLRTVLAEFPMAGRSLDILLQRARLDPRHETGRITLFLARPAPEGRTPRSEPGFLIQLGSFRDPGRLQVAVANAFPAEGTLAIDHRDFPLFVITDAHPLHIRAMADGEGRVWLGDVAALAGLDLQSGRSRPGLAAAAEWTTAGAAVQGFIRPQDLREDTNDRLAGDLARDLPRGIESVAWALTPGRGPNAPNGFELSLAGTPEAVERAAAWLGRLVAVATSVPGLALDTPEILQESRRIGLRCQVSQEQVDVLLAKLNQPPIRLQ
jgi:hypothetical protein